MSPEQSAGEFVDWRTDMYSLAVTLYEALSARKIPLAAYEDLSVMNEGIPPQIDELIFDCLQPQDQRLETPRAFASRLAGALRPMKPLSEVLAHGRLHEIAAAVQQLSPEEFAHLPAGQRALILAKVSDIVSSGEPALQFASEHLLGLLLTRALLVDTEDYREVVKPAIQWAFQIMFGANLGRDSIRRALENAAYQARPQAHTVLKEEFAAFLVSVDLSNKEDWYLHAIREVIETLLANPSCTADTADLVAALREVNRNQRSRHVPVG